MLVREPWIKYWQYLSKTEMHRLFRSGHDIVLPLLFYALSFVMLGFMQAQLNSSIICLLFIYALLIPLPAMVSADVEDGTLDSIRLARVPMGLYGLVKLQTLWLGTAVPLLLITPLVTGLTEMVISIDALMAFTVFSLAVSGLLTLLAMIVTGQQSLFYAVLALPLLAPLLLFCHIAITQEHQYEAAMSFMLAMFLMTLAILPWLAGFMLRDIE